MDLKKALSGTGLKMPTNFRTLDLFSGCGGLSLGLSMSGNENEPKFETVMAIDNWGVACKTFEKNLGITPVCTSITSAEIEILLRNLGRVDLVVGGPPCQGFSTSGKRALDDPRNDLVWSYIKAVEILQPQAFLMENVSGFASFVGGKLLAEVKQYAVDLGYHVRAAILQASRHGVPQRRRRFVLVGSKNAGYLFPGEETPQYLAIPSDGIDYEQEIDPSVEISFNSAVSDLPEISAGASAENYLTAPKNSFQASMRNGSQQLSLHTAVGHGPKMLRLFEFIPEGKSAFDSEVFELIPEEIRPGGGFKNSYARISGNRPAPTITRNFTTPSSANCIHPKQNRALSLREGARAQSFPDSFDFHGTTDQIRLQIGNAVPPLLGKALGDSLLRHLNGATMASA